jgi:hypothetical protein
MKLTVKLLVPTAISSVYHTELLLEGEGFEVIPSSIYEMNLEVCPIHSIRWNMILIMQFLNTGGKVRDPTSPFSELRPTYLGN